jgi:hypothetical protein
MAKDNNINIDDDGISPGQKREEKLREQFLKQSVIDMNALYQSLGKEGRAMKIKSEESYWIFESKPEKNEREEE